MSTIIAGRFDTLEAADKTRKELTARHISAENVASFFVNPPGQHDLLPSGGDENADPGARVAHVSAAKGATLGGVVGLGVGLAAAAGAAPIAGIAAAASVAAAATGVGAYTGSLLGTLSGVDDGVNDDDGKGEESPPSAPRQSGVLVAVKVEQDDARKNVLDTLVRCGAQDIEIAHGTLDHGEWTDFDPRVPPVPVALITPPDQK